MSGCAPQARPKTPAAAEEASVDVEATLQRIDEVYADGQYERAGALLEGLSRNSEQLSEQQRTLVEEKTRRVDSILHERRIAPEQAVAQAPAEPPATGAEQRSPEQPKPETVPGREAAAGKEGASEQAGPAEPAREVEERVLAEQHDTETGTEAAAGPKPEVRREQCGKLLAMSDRYETAGEFEKAVEVLSLVQQAPPGLAPEQLRSRASEKLEVLAHRVKEQKREADRIISMFQRPRRLLEEGNVEAARETYEQVIEEARMANLTGEAAVSVFAEAHQVLQQDFASALRREAPDYTQEARRMLEQARDNLATSLSRMYLEAGNPEGAEPHLRRVAERASGETASWAEQKLEELDQVKERAREERLQQTADQIQRAYELARKYTALAREGRLDAAARTAQKLADARVELAAQKASLALDRWAWEEAGHLLDGAPAAAATAALVENNITPLRRRLQTATSAAGNLKAAEQAIGEGNFQKASGLLEAAWELKPLPEPLALRLETLAGVLEPVRRARAREMEQRNWRRTGLRSVEEKLAQLEQREQGWEDYLAILRGVVAGELEEAREELSVLLSQPAGLEEAEVAHARSLFAGLAEDPEAARAAAQERLQEARELLEDGRYVEAAEALKALRGMEGHSLVQGIRRRTGKLEAEVREAEARAEQLYRAAVQARENNEVERLKDILEELNSSYRHTRIFQERR
ncbi:MAG: hypothetical protein R6X33_07740 [Candidatus Brocadiia bacterium]